MRDQDGCETDIVREKGFAAFFFSHLHTPLAPFSPSLISLTVSVDVKYHVYHVYLLTKERS